MHFRWRDLNGTIVRQPGRAGRHKSLVKASLFGAWLLGIGVIVAGMMRLQGQNERLGRIVSEVPGLSQEAALGAGILVVALTTLLVAALCGLGYWMRRAAMLARALKRQQRKRRQVLTYLAMTSHELRTPLHGMLGHADLLRTELTAGGARESSEAIIESGQHLLALLDQLLAVAKIDLVRETRDEVRAKVVVPVDVDRVIAEVARLMSGTAHAKGLVLETSPPAGCAALAAPQTLRQALQNLVDNAIKFTDHGSVRISATCTSADRCRITVTDSGRGMSPAEQRGLFGVFEARQPALGGQFQGSGLGLYLTRKTIMSIGGRVGFTSESGKGSTFWLELPAVRLAASPGHGGNRHPGSAQTAAMAPTTAPQ